MEPQVVLPGDGGQPSERVDGPGAHGACVAHEKEGRVPAGPISLDLPEERVHVHHEVAAHRNPPNALGSVAEEIRGLLDPGVGLRRGVDQEASGVTAKALLPQTLSALRAPRGQEAHEVGHVAAAHQQPFRLPGQAQEVAHPPDALGFHLGGHGRELPTADVGIDGGGKQVPQGTDGSGGGPDVPEEARVAVEERVVQDDWRGLGEEARRIDALVGKRVRQEVADGAWGLGRGHRTVGKRLRKRRDLVDQPVARFAEGVRGHLQRGRSVSQVGAHVDSSKRRDSLSHVQGGLLRMTVGVPDRKRRSLATPPPGRPSARRGRRRASKDVVAPPASSATSPAFSAGSRVPYTRLRCGSKDGSGSRPNCRAARE